MEVLSSTIARGIAVNGAGIKGVIRLRRPGREGKGREGGGGGAPSVSVNASPPEWPINSNYGKEATITRLRGSILNPRTLYSPGFALAPVPATTLLCPLGSDPCRGGVEISYPRRGDRARARARTFHREQPEARYTVFPCRSGPVILTATRCTSY